MPVAQTNIQLYNQLRGRGDSIDDLLLVHRAYELLTTLYPARFQADGKPFVSHGVGVASILADLGKPADLLAVGLLHNVYGNADFGDGGRPGATPGRRRVLREAVGEHIEELVHRFPALRITPATVDDLAVGLSERDERDRAVLLVDLADHLEKHVDLGVLYYGQNDWIREGTEAIAEKLVAMANDLGEPMLGQALRKAFADTAAAADAVPAELRPSDGRRYGRVIAPRSYKRRAQPRAAAQRVVQRARDRVRLRTRLRALWPSASG